MTTINYKQSTASSVHEALDTEPLKMRSVFSSSVNSFDSLMEKEMAKEKVDATTKDIEAQPTLKLFESPLAHGQRDSDILNAPEAAGITISGRTGLSRTKLRDEDDELYKGRLDDAELRETPEFKRYEEATNIELFYDLFFVANLTTFTDVHNVNNVSALKAYAGFFCILWFLWAQVSLFDVRFVQDSILERIGKACQFGVMVGLAIVGPQFDPSQQEQHAFQILALILMVSRIVLGFQYGVVLREVWYYKNTKIPLSTLVMANFVAAFVYLGTFFAFKPNHPHSNFYIVWYVTAVLETIVNIAVSSRWEVLTFTGTHLVKRMSLLTLIILGEGIIALCKSITTIIEHEDSLTGPLIGTIISAVVIFYFIYMIYFDWLNPSDLSSFREGLWTFLHFPFHLALVLPVEGAAQFILWRKVVEVVRSVNHLFLGAKNNFTTGQSSDLALLFTNVTNTIFSKFEPELSHTLKDATKALNAIGNATLNSTEQLREITTLFAVVQDSLFKNFGIETPESKMKMNMTMMMGDGEVDVDPNAEFLKNMDAFKLIFIYFFISSGITLIIMDALSILSHRRKTTGDYMRISVNFIIGIVLCSVASIVNSPGGFEFAQSAWILPTAATGFVFVMSLSYTKLP